MTPVDHRGSGWTLWREIYGTFIGVLPLILAVGGAAMAVIRDNDRHELEIRHLKEADVRQEDQIKVLKNEGTITRNEIIVQLNNIGSKIESLQVQVARINK